MADKRKIYFRADAGQETGYGHFIRSLALADVLKRDFDCTMFTQTPTCYQLREANDICPVVALPADNRKFDLFLNRLQGDETVVLDNYFFTTDYQQEIKARGCRLVCIDDMHDKHYVADVVINHGTDDASLFDAEPYTRLCIGYPYALLRKPFRETPKGNNRVKGLVVVCFGGSDPHNLTKRYVEHLIKGQTAKHIVAVTGDGYRHPNELTCFPDTEVRSRLSADEMADLFRRAETVVCSASTTAYEALACGAKVYAGWYADNQRDFYQYLCTARAIIPLGNLLESTFAFDTQTDTKPINLTASGYNLRKVFWQQLLREVNYTELSEQESRQVWETRNLPDIRKWMFNSQPFLWEEHSQFVAGLSQRKDKLYMAFFDGNRPVASYDLTGIHDGQAECGLYVHPDYEGRGIASMIEERMEQTAQEKGIRLLTSRVLNNNTASLTFFARNGYARTGEENQVIRFEKRL